MNSDRTLRSILSIISRDVRLIRREARKKRLDPDTAMTLSRYANTLNSIRQEEEFEKEKEKKRLNRLSTEELVKMYLNEQKKNKILPDKKLRKTKP